MGEHLSQDAYEPRLEADEVIEKKAWATSFKWGGQGAGILTLTSHRLVWRPDPHSDRFSWEVVKEAVKDVSVEPKGLGLVWRYTVLVNAAGGNHRFEIGGEAKAEEWAAAIRKWAGLE